METAIALIEMTIPNGSQIKVIQSEDFVDIVIPSKNSINDIIASAIWKIIQTTCFFIGVLIIATLSPSFSTESIIFFLLFFGIGLSPLVLKAIFDLFGNVRIRICSCYVQLFYEVWMIKFHGSKLLTENLSALSKNPSIRIVNGGRVPLLAEPRLTVHANDKKLEIRHDNITDLELEWLIRILSQLLCLPIWEK